MKKVKSKQIYIMLSAVALMLNSCSAANDFEEIEQKKGNGGQEVVVSEISNEPVEMSMLTSLDIKINDTTLVERDDIPESKNDSDYKAYLETNFSYVYAIAVELNDDGATVAGQRDNDTVVVKGGKVEIHSHNKGLAIYVSGTVNNGGLKIYSEKKFKLQLSNASITSCDGSAINIQDGKCFLVLDGENQLSDSESAKYQPSSLLEEYAERVETEDEKAVLFSEDDLCVSAATSAARLVVSAKNQSGKAAVSCDDEIFIRPQSNIKITCAKKSGNGIKANDRLTIKGGVLNVETSAAGSKALSCDGHVAIRGGRTTGITTGGVSTVVASDPSGCAGIKADSSLTISGGEVLMKSSGQGGKGISCDDVINISGGTIKIQTTGSRYGSSGGGGWRAGNTPGSWDDRNKENDRNNGNSVSPKGIKGDKNINISGGEIFVLTKGTNAEGIESKAILSFTGGRTAVSAYDDGLNAETAITMTGGKVFAMSNGQGDGIDSNGYISVTGGTMIGVASTMESEEGIDLENSTFTFKNSTIISLSGGTTGGGGMGMGMGMGASYNGHYISNSISGTAGSYLALTQPGDSIPLVVFSLPRRFQSGSVLLSTPTLATGNYTMLSGTAPSGGIVWMNLYEPKNEGDVIGVSGGRSTTVAAK